MFYKTSSKSISKIVMGITIAFSSTVSEEIHTGGKGDRKQTSNEFFFSIQEWFSIKS